MDTAPSLDGVTTQVVPLSMAAQKQRLPVLLPSGARHPRGVVNPGSLSYFNPGGINDVLRK
jgi:hypothetical protein